MTNRQKYFLKRDGYDLLLSVKYNVQQPNARCHCPIAIIGGDKPPCKILIDEPDIKDYIGDGAVLCRGKLDCKSCIQQWLNEEAVP